jgi:Domain of unknown function (DUF6378)
MFTVESLLKENEELRTQVFKLEATTERLIDEYSTEIKRLKNLEDNLRAEINLINTQRKLADTSYSSDFNILKNQAKTLTEANNELTEACDLYRDELDTFKTTTSPKALPITLDAAQLLQLSADTLTERGKQYDSSGATKERSMAAVVKSFNTIYGTNLTEQQGWNFMVLLKMKRGADKAHQDSALDMIAYAALAGETVFNK